MSTTIKNKVTGTGEVAFVGVSARSHGMTGEALTDGVGVIGTSDSGEGVSGFSKSGHGVVGQSDAQCGVRGLGKVGRGVEGCSQAGDGLHGISETGQGLVAESQSGHGVVATSGSASAILATSTSGRGVEGWSGSSYGVSGDSGSSAGLRGTSRDGRGVEGWSPRREGVVGITETGTGVWGVAGRSPLLKDSVTLFDPGAAAKRWADSARTVPPHDVPHPAPPVEEPRPAMSVEASDVHELAARMANASDEREAAAGHAMAFTQSVTPVTHRSLDTSSVTADGPIESHLGVVFDDTAGIGVLGEHRGGGTAIKGYSRSGTGVAAYSDSWEAVHAETQSLGVAAIAAYNLNPRATGAAVFAKKVGTHGHAGFFDGRVWIGGELGVGGDILLANADCAEDFDVVSPVLAEPGSVMVLGEDGVLHPCANAYDKRVAGVISGAGSYRPGLILDKQRSATARSPVSLLGKVCCKASAVNGPIAIGDLLTTSPIEGHAMKASDPARAFGAVIGKAMQPLHEGSGLVAILIALQ